uniref:LPXTG cell wall anchor domain-containing protein n=1 Tax=Ruminococcus sp. TaxID=41978 RepID=UPI0025D3352D
YTHTSENLPVGTYTAVISTGKGTVIEKSFTTTIKSDVLLTYVQDSDEFTFVELGTITPESKDNTNPTASIDVSSSTSDVVLKDSTNSNNDNGVVKTGDSPVVSIVLLSALTLAAAGMFFAKRRFDF